MKTQKTVLSKIFFFKELAISSIMITAIVCAGVFASVHFSQADTTALPQTPAANPQTPGNSTATTCTNGTATAGVCFPNNTGLPDPTGGISGIAKNVLNWMLGIFTTIAIIAFVISGLQYLTSTGDEEQLTIAKRNAKWSMVGVLVGLSGYVILQAVQAALTASSSSF